MNRDRYDLPLTTASDRAAAHYRDGVDCMLSAWHGADDAFDQAIAEDPGFALAHIARARLHQLNMEGSEARAMAAQARQLAAGATARERGHVEIMAAVIESKPKLAVSGAEAHLDEYPRDALVLSMLLGAFGLYAFSGRPDHDAARLAICERHAAPLWRGLVVPELSRLVAHRGRKSRHRPRLDRTRDGVAIRQRQCRAWPLACDVRARRHGSRPQLSVAMAAGA